MRASCRYLSFLLLPVPLEQSLRFGHVAYVTANDSLHGASNLRQRVIAPDVARFFHGYCTVELHPVGGFGLVGKVVTATVEMFE
jgi:hypothetical protein